MTKTIYKLLAGWLLLAALNAELTALLPRLDTTLVFPISIFKLEFHPDGLKFVLVFVLLLWAALKFAPRLNILSIWGIRAALIFFANMGQGNFDKAFIGPFVNSGQQYFYDAIKILSGREFLSTFNEQQALLTQHSRTHPAFAVLIHFIFLALGGSQVAPLSIGFTLLASLSIPLMYEVFGLLDIPKTRKNLLTLLFAIIPAVNIYSGVSLDGVILTTSLLFLYGLVRMIRGGVDWIGMIGFAAGILFTNLLTFGGTFLLAVGGLMALYELIRKKDRKLILVWGGTLLAGAILIVGLNITFHYDHLKAFFTASRLENPQGFFGWADPFNYLITRLEDISEIGLFLSVGCLALFFHPEKLQLKRIDYQDPVSTVAMAGVITLMLVLISGAFKTGETARAALFIYPYIFLVFRNLDEGVLSPIILLAGAQTALMQVFGNYFW